MGARLPAQLFPKNISRQLDRICLHAIICWSTPRAPVSFIVEIAGHWDGRSLGVAAIEVERAERWNWSWEKRLRPLAQSSGVKVDRIVGVHFGSRCYFVDDLQVWPHAEFVKALHAS